MYKIFFEAIVYGILAVIIGLIFTLIFKQFSFDLKEKLPDECKNWNKYYIMEISLFVVGFFLRYSLQLPVINNLVNE